MTSQGETDQVSEASVPGEQNSLLPTGLAEDELVGFSTNPLSRTSKAS